MRLFGNVAESRVTGNARGCFLNFWCGAYKECTQLVKCVYDMSLQRNASSVPVCDGKMLFNQLPDKVGAVGCVDQAVLLVKAHLDRLVRNPVT